MTLRVSYNCRPEFPDSMVDRYPNLTRALGGHYPGVQSARQAENCQGYSGSTSGPATPIASPTIQPFAPLVDQNCARKKSEASYNNHSFTDANNHLPQLNLKPHASTAKVIDGGSSFMSDKFIPICNADSHELHTLARSPSAGYSVKSSNISSSPTRQHDQGGKSGLSEQSKAHRCLWCHSSFTWPSELQRHEKTHTGEQPFACESPGCLKKFGVRSNCRRHQREVHGIGRAGRHGQIAPYEITFRPPAPCPSVVSDTTSLSVIVWDHEGPFSRQAPQTTTRGGLFCRTLGDGNFDV
ncbi:hypothetical protein DFH06DRAFT_1297140 [Mycena polygramma]|nr:hypothetical protein DFH06DRAFT_1297140 [Mycena polygramma]